MGGILLLLSKSWVVIEMRAGVLARAARAASGLTQIEFASRSGIAGSSLSLIEHGKREPTVATLDTLLRAARQTVVAIPTVRSDAAGIASEIAIALVEPDGLSVYRRFLQLADNLAAESGATRVGLTLTEPSPTGSEQWDAAIAALCEYRLKADHLPVPNWIIKRVGFPTRPWAPSTSRYNIPADPTKVPEEFLRRGILIEAQTLESV